MTLIKFYADWCQPCKSLSSVIQTKGLSDRFVDVNIETTDQSVQDMLTRFDVRSIPTIVRDNGDSFEKFVGAPACTKLINTL
jgi:thioredoxin-like negative regulator of GroEL